MNKLKKILKEVAKAFIVLVLLSVALNLYALWHTREITSVSAYEKIKNKRWHRADLVAHFPKSIPREAKEPKFYYHPGFLQGGPTIELRILMPDDFVEKEIVKSRRKAKLILKRDQKFGLNKDTFSAICKSRFNTFPKEEFQSAHPSALLPADFEIFLISSRPYETDPISWNHGDCSGISVSKKRNEIIYWAENW